MSDRFKIDSLVPSGLFRITRIPIEDQRGYFERMYCSDVFAKMGLLKPIAQVNHALTRRRGSVRGMHYQTPPHAEMKLVSCLRGEIYDVAVDLRAGSPTFRKWHGEVLSERNRRSLLIPEGFAHGFQALSDDCELLYLHSEPYNPEFEGGLHPFDPSVAIEWPLAVADISQRDAGRSLLTDDFGGIPT